jgi:hypothetical protein
MINMETSLPEAYPDGWWDLVVEVRVCHTLCGCGKLWWIVRQNADVVCSRTE